MWRAILFIFAGPLTVDHGFGQWPGASPKAIEVINTWSDSLYQWQQPPPRFLNFHGKPLCVSITECNMDGADPQKFDAKQPFKDLPCEAGSITTFRFDTLGRVLSRSMRGAFLGRIHDPEDQELDSLVYGPEGMVTWFSMLGSGYGTTRQYQWQDGHVVEIELMSNGFVTQRTTLHYDDPHGIVESETTSARDPQRVFRRMTLLNKDTVLTDLQVQGTDSTLISYQYFPDSVVIRYRSDPPWRDETESGFQAQTTRWLPNSKKEVRTYSSPNDDDPEVELFLQERLVRTKQGCSESEVTYNEHQDPERIIEMFTCEELGSMKPMRNQYYYAYDSHGNPVRILYLSGLDQYNRWHRSYSGGNTYWRIAYAYP